MALISEISRGSGQRSVAELRQAALAQFIAAFALAAYVHFYEMTGNADKPRDKSDQFSAGDTRTTSTDYTVKEREPNFADVTLRIYGDKVETDIAHERRGQDIGSQRLLDLEDFCESLGWYFMDALINHDNGASAEQFTGLKAQAAAHARNTVLDDGSGNGFALITGNDNAARQRHDAFIEALDAAIEDIVGGPDVITMDGKSISRFTSVARGLVTYSTVRNVFGAEERVASYRDIPIVNSGFKNDGAGLVIPHNETVGTSTDCTSIYLARFGEKRHVSLATNVGLDVQDMGLIGTKWQSLVEFDVDLVVLHDKAFKRLSGLRIV